MKIRIKIPGMPNVEETDLTEFLDKSISQAKTAGMPFAGIQSKTIFTPFPINSPGKIEVIVEADGESYTCGALNMISVKPEVIAASAATGTVPATT